MRNSAATFRSEEYGRLDSFAKEFHPLRKPIHARYHRIVPEHLSVADAQPARRVADRAFENRAAMIQLASQANDEIP